MLYTYKHPSNLLFPTGTLTPKNIVKRAKFQHLITTLAHDTGFNVRDLELQVMLHIPKIMREHHFLLDEQVYKVIYNACNLLAKRVAGFEHYFTPPAKALESPQANLFCKIPESEAHIIHEHFHYIGSPRRNSLHFGLRMPTSGKVSTLLSFSEFDLEHIYPCIPLDLESQNIMVLSRGFAFDWAPPNKMSYLMAKVWQWMADNKPEVRMLITYVNPNLGFTGSAYKASNWVYFGEEAGTRYCYLDGEYITDRELYRKFGTAKPARLEPLLRDRFEVSRLPLLPLTLFSYFIDKQARLAYQDGFSCRVARP